MAYFDPPADKGYMGDRRRGASMGRPNRDYYFGKDGKPIYVTVNKDAKPFLLRRVRMVGDGAYDAGGAYWGIGEPLYYFEGPLSDINGYVRGKTREAAKEAVRRLHEHAKFYR